MEATPIRSLIGYTKPAATVLKAANPNLFSYPKMTDASVSLPVAPTLKKAAQGSTMVEEAFPTARALAPMGKFSEADAVKENSKVIV